MSTISYQIWVYLALAFLIGLLSTRVMKLIKMPNVTGYLLTGVIIGPYVLGALFNAINGGGYSSTDLENTTLNPIYGLVDNLSWIPTLALGFIAFTIGTSFKLSTVKKLGKRIAIITLLESLCAAVVVFISLLIIYFINSEVDLSIILSLAAISCATAPAATLLVIKQYKAKGPLVNTLLPVVALDDAVALACFAILFAIATGLKSGTIDIYSMLGKPVIEIVLSLAIGIALGFALTFICKLFKSRANRSMFVIFCILACIGIQYLFEESYMGSFELSSLLMCMMVGAVFVNFRQDVDATINVIDRITPPIFMLFFITSGAELKLTVFFEGNYSIVLICAAVYIISRVIGKRIGAFSGSVITKAEPQVKKYLGFCLIPQAGVAIGLASTAGRVLSGLGDSNGDLIVAIILTSTIIYEFVGPALAKFSLTKAGEIPLEIRNTPLPTTENK